MLGSWQSWSEVMTLNTALMQHCMCRVVVVWEKDEVLESWSLINFVKNQAFHIISFCACNKNVIFDSCLYGTSECPRSKDRILMLLFIFHKIYSHLFSLKSICNSKFYNIFCLWECLECLVTLCALEWLLHGGPLMFFQVASYWEDLVILWAIKRLLSRVGLVPW